MSFKILRRRQVTNHSGVNYRQSPIQTLQKQYQAKLIHIWVVSLNCAEDACPHCLCLTAFVIIKHHVIIFEEKKHGLI